MAENKKTIFRGVGTALITPMRDGEVDYPPLRTLIDRQVELGADALVICGTTGESATLSDTERRRCIASAIEYTDGRVPVIAGTGSNNIEKGGVTVPLRLRCRSGRAARGNSVLQQGYAGGAVQELSAHSAQRIGTADTI